MAEIKICGLSTPETLEAALAAGTDYTGFMFYEPSPRNISLETARELRAQTGARAKKVAVTVDAGDEKLDLICEALGPDYIQAHGSETPARVAEISRRTGVPVIKAIKVRDAGDIAAAADFAGVAEMILFDAKAPETLKDALPGGNGVSFDWSLMDSGQDQPRFMLSGGLHAGNLQQAIEITRAPIVDVSSGVESAPGTKDSNLIRAFVSAAKRL